MIFKALGTLAAIFLSPSIKYTRHITMTFQPYILKIADMLKLMTLTYYPPFGHLFSYSSDHSKWSDE